MEHFSLTVFSICIQAAIGMMVFVGIARVLNKDGVFKNAVVAASVLGVVGMLASLLHLGRPFSAIRALNQFGTSWLSREIWFTAAFVGLTVVVALLLYIKPENKGAITGLTWAAAVVGLADVFFMASIYSQSSILVWQSNATMVEFYAAAISMGAVLFLALSLKEAANMRKIVALSLAAIVIIQVAVVVPELVAMGSNSSASMQSSLVMLGSMGLMNSIKWLAILAGAGLIVWLGKDELSQAMVSAVAGSAVLLMVGQVVGRYLFYASMVIPTIGLS